ncbi:hypothetical protein CALVIDRAFT_519519, partial [Calocera viscosa TUFC12733]
MSSLGIALCRNHSSGAVKELGTVEQSLLRWCEATNVPTPLQPMSSSKMQINLFLVPFGRTVLNWGSDYSSLREAIQNAVQGADALHRSASTMDTSKVVAGVNRSAVAGVNRPAVDIDDFWKPLFQNLGWFVYAMDQMTE